MKMELKINSYIHRMNVVNAVVNAGYKVSVEERKQEGEVLRTKIDYYVVVEESK